MSLISSTDLLSRRQLLLAGLAASAATARAGRSLDRKGRGDVLGQDHRDDDGQGSRESEQSAGIPVSANSKLAVRVDSGDPRHVCQRAGNFSNTDGLAGAESDGHGPDD